MATAVASRFAVLSIDDDDDVPKKSQPKKKPDPKKPASGQNQSNSNKKKNPKKNDSGKANQNNQNTANKNKSKQGGKGDGNKEGSQKKKGGGGNVAQDQWDQWKKKDSELVDCTYEQDLHQAILLSKLDYEEKKDVYEQTKKSVEEERKQSSKKSKKANKPQPMSLEEFNNLQDQGASDGEAVTTAEPQPQQVQPDTEFFERIRSDTKKVLTKEQEADRRKAREPFIQQAITVAQLEDQLEKKSRENELLKEEIVKLKEELHNVRTRNKKLCNILAQGEMKDKAEVLVEVDQLQRMRDELSSEVSSLHAQLEQERSKVRALTSDSKGRPQSKKQRSTSETNHQ